jgi:hypothetical protein
MSSAPVYTAAGARQLDRAAVAEAAARAAQQQAVAREAEAMAQLRIEQAQAQAAEQARERAFARQAVEAEQAQARRAAKAARRADRRTARAEIWTARRPLLVVIPMMATSAAVALPAQYVYYAGVTGNAWSGATIAGMVEGGTWLGAALESSAINRRRPAGFYRGLTWTLAGLAAAVNFAHGLTLVVDGKSSGGWQVGVVFALASLMGVVSWSAYVRLRTHQDSDTSPEQLRLAAWRRLRYPRLSWRAASLRAAIGPSLSVADAWVQVWAEHHGAPAGLQPVAPLETVEVVGVDPVEPREVVTAPVDLDRVDLDHKAESVESGGSLDLLELISGQQDDPPPAVDSTTAQAVALAGASLGSAVEVRPVVPVWIEPLADWGEPDRLVPDQDDDVDSVTVDLLSDLAAAIAAGDLPEDASAEAVRKYLGIAWRTAKSLLDERDTRARTAVAA